MNLDWQTTISLIVVALAFVGILRHLGRSLVAPDGCGGCHSCPKNEEAEPEPIIQINTDRPRG